MFTESSQICLVPYFLYSDNFYCFTLLWEEKVNREWKQDNLWRSYINKSKHYTMSNTWKWKNGRKFWKVRYIIVFLFFNHLRLVRALEVFQNYILAYISKESFSGWSYFFVIYCWHFGESAVPSNDRQLKLRISQFYFLNC